jgi:hypothetical protein
MSSAAVPRFKKQRILVVDGEPDFAGIVQQNLKKKALRSRWPMTATKGFKK